MRPILSRMLVGASNAPLNYSGLFMYMLLTIYVVAKFRFNRANDV